VKKGEEIRERRKKKEMKRKVKGVWPRGEMKKIKKGGNEKMLGGEMQKKKKRGKLESVVGYVYLMHAANWPRVKNTRKLAA
jgi:hypothetical protein